MKLLEITLYTQTIEDAILDNPDLSEKDKSIITKYMDTYIDYMEKTLFKDENININLQDTAQTPGVLYHATEPDGRPIDITLPDFWEWYAWHISTIQNKA
jgi:hypothetical protein